MEMAAPALSALRNVVEIYRDYTARRSGLVRALTSGTRRRCPRRCRSPRWGSVHQGRHEEGATGSRSSPSTPTPGSSPSSTSTPSASRATTVCGNYRHNMPKNDMRNAMGTKRGR
ncbi:hypothetical protein C2845_PM05G18610 [Panicum miliaceum]|uniref:Uncharacterized protein n=1 Tax=Panicum miliaceum TaxID=4540 RepID=A0A3L6SYM7_PANMI|nr:hypothetical protein C2845_PM05G18610 [Panicum miliaceum]